MDHAKKEQLPGTCVAPEVHPEILPLSRSNGINSYSYTYIEKSIQKGTLESLEEHIVGPPAGTVRSVGSISRPAKSARTSFTAEDDRLLWTWVEKSRTNGDSIRGNEIYKQLEAAVSQDCIHLELRLTNLWTEPTAPLAIVEKSIFEAAQ